MPCRGHRSYDEPAKSVARQIDTCRCTSCGNRGGTMRYLYVFLIGGLLCAIAQILIDKTKLTPARILVIYVCAGIFLTAINLYEPLVDFAGAGALVPIVGFGHTLAQGMKEAVALAMDNERLERLSANIASLAIVDSADRVVAEIEKILTK